jgi:hypothetical protein
VREGGAATERTLTYQREAIELREMRAGNEAKLEQIQKAVEYPAAAPVPAATAPKIHRTERLSDGRKEISDRLGKELGGLADRVRTSTVRHCGARSRCPQ